MTTQMKVSLQRQKICHRFLPWDETVAKWLLHPFIWWLFFILGRLVEGLAHAERVMR